MVHTVYVRVLNASVNAIAIEKVNDIALYI